MSSELIPLNPSIIMCCQQPIMAVQLPDGPIAATPLSFCKALRLNYPGQLQRIRRNESLVKYLRLAPIRTNGRVREMDVLIVEALPRWLSTLQVSRLAPEKQQLARALQQQAEDALVRHFSEEAMRKAAPSPPKTERGDSARSQRKMAHKAFERLHQVADALQQAGDTIHDAADALREATDELDEIYMVAQEEKEAMGDHIVALEVKQKALEERKAGNATQARKQQVSQDGPILTAEHRNPVYALARHLRDQTGEPLAAMFAELAEMFGVADMSDIPDAGWEEVATWFWERRQRTVVEEQR